MPHYFIKRLRIVNHYTAALTRSDIILSYVRRLFCSSTERTAPERRKRRAAHPADSLEPDWASRTATAENTAKSENDMPP